MCSSHKHKFNAMIGWIPIKSSQWKVRKNYLNIIIYQCYSYGRNGGSSSPQDDDDWWPSKPLDGWPAIRHAVCEEEFIRRWGRTEVTGWGYLKKWLLLYSRPPSIDLCEGNFNNYSKVIDSAAWDSRRYRYGGALKITLKREWVINHETPNKNNQLGKHKTWESSTRRRSQSKEICPLWYCELPVMNTKQWISNQLPKRIVIIYCEFVFWITIIKRG